VVCDDEAMAVWMLQMIVAENVSVRREGTTLFLPADPTFRLEEEIKNVIIAVAKTHHIGQLTLWKQLLPLHVARAKHLCMHQPFRQKYCAAAAKRG